jgi:hypothetical protein
MDEMKRLILICLKEGGPAKSHCSSPTNASHDGQENVLEQTEHARPLAFNLTYRSFIWARIRPKK